MTQQRDYPLLTTPPSVTIRPEPGSRLDALLAQLPDAQASADQTAERLATLKDAIKEELHRHAPGERDIRCITRGLRKPLRLVERESWRLDTEAMKRDDPTSYVRFARKIRTWVLLVK